MIVRSSKRTLAQASRGSLTFDILNVIFMLVMCAMFIYPFAYVMSRSVMTDAERIARPFGLIPRAFDFSAYKLIFSDGSAMMNAYGLTIMRTVVGTACNLFFTALISYVISRKDYPLRLPLTTMLVFTMWFSGGLIPTYLVNQAYGLVNNFWVYILPGLISPWNALIMRNFFSSIPDSLEESARIDGASEMTILWRIILPLSKASLATIGLFYAVAHWNAWFDSMLYMTERENWVLQYGILRAYPHHRGGQIDSQGTGGAGVQSLPAAGRAGKKAALDCSQRFENPLSCHIYRP